MRRHNLRKITGRRCYSTEEIADLFNIHIQTVRAWRKQGMKPIEATTSPFLFLGSAIRDFLSQELTKQKTKLKSDECYCLRCKKGVRPINPSTLNRNIGIGKNKQSVFILGSCPVCGLKLRRFSSLSIDFKPAIKQEVKSVVSKTNQIEQLNLLRFEGED